jgi:Lysozyme like domain
MTVMTGTSTGTLSYAQLKAVWLQAAAGTKYGTNAWASLMAAIAEAESGGDAYATNPNDNNGTQTSWGLWQISNGTHGSVSSQWASPVVNAQLALGKLEDQGLSAWGTYTSGAYKAYLSDKTSPDGSGIPAVTTADTSAASLSAETASDCLFPGGSRSLGLGLSFPCLISYGNARALIAGGVILLGGAIGLFGLAGLAEVTGALGAMQQAGGSAAKTAGALATFTGSPEIGAPLAAAGGAVKKSGTEG